MLCKKTVEFFPEHFNQKFLTCCDHVDCVIVAAIRCLQLLIILHRRLTAYAHISCCCEHRCLTARNAAIHFCIIHVSLYITVAVTTYIDVHFNVLYNSHLVYRSKEEKKVTIFVDINSISEQLTS